LAADDQPDAPSSGDRQLRLTMLLGIAVSLLFLWLALRTADLGEIIDAAARTRLPLALPFLAAVLLFYWTKTVRWRALLAPMKSLAPRDLIAPVMIGYAGSIVLPMQLGELVRVLVAQRTFQLRASTLLGSVALERMFDLLTIALFMTAALLFARHMPPELALADEIIAPIAMAGLALALAFIRWTDKFIAGAARATAFLPARVCHFLLDQLAAAAGGMESLNSPRRIAYIGALSVVQWGFMWTCSYLSLLAVGIHATAGLTTLVLGFTTISISLPTSPGYVGSIQFAYYLALVPFGVSPSDAFAASVFFHVLTNGTVIVAGLYYARHTGFSLRKLSREVRHPVPTQRPQ
jgi:uncharacterized protein (TIRG00374 family)